jgi:hypothetical protein
MPTLAVGTWRFSRVFNMPTLVVGMAPNLSATECSDLRYTSYNRHEPPARRPSATDAPP